MTASVSLTAAERLKFELLAEGLHITAPARDYIDVANAGRAMTPADYASTSGIILKLEDDVWVNAPILLYNSNFVSSPKTQLELRDGHLMVRNRDVESPARFWLPPAYHGGANPAGEEWNSYAFTHADRVRISPIEGCAIACQFCNLPYEFKYRRKSVSRLVESVKRAIMDEIQPAYHVLISGGTPAEGDFGYVRDVYEAVGQSFPSVAIDVMMMPLPGLLDPRWLDRIGVSELSVNIEIYNRARARRIMRRKFDLTLEHYLNFLAAAAETMGPGRVRSMLLVGVEPMEETLAGVAAIAERGCVPVLSPFRPDPGTPMSMEPPPTSAFLMETYLRAHDLVLNHDVPLGPSCIPCSHNTLTLAAAGSGDADTSHGHPRLA